LHARHAQTARAAVHRCVLLSSASPHVHVYPILFALPTNMINCTPGTYHGSSSSTQTLRYCQGRGEEIPRRSVFLSSTSDLSPPLGRSRLTLFFTLPPPFQQTAMPRALVEVGFPVTFGSAQMSLLSSPSLSEPQFLLPLVRTFSSLLSSPGLSPRHWHLHLQSAHMSP
jgi:hypothetical protein